MMTFSVSTVDCSEFIFFRGKQIILHSFIAIDSTFDARVQNKRILQASGSIFKTSVTVFHYTDRPKAGK